MDSDNLNDENEKMENQGILNEIIEEEKLESMSHSDVSKDSDTKSADTNELDENDKAQIQLFNAMMKLDEKNECRNASKYLTKQKTNRRMGIRIDAGATSSMN